MLFIHDRFGHQDLIVGLDTLSKERCVTVGSRDKTMRLWKIPEESQLVFRGGGGITVSEDLVVMDDLRKNEKRKGNTSTGGSIDVVAMIDEDNFLSGDDSG